MNVFKQAAQTMGWKWSPAHDGYIHENRRNRPNSTFPGWDSYEVAADAEEACFAFGMASKAKRRRATS